MDGGEDEPDDLAVNGAGDAVLQFEIHLGHGVFGENRGVGDVTCFAPPRAFVREHHLWDFGRERKMVWIRKDHVRIAADSTMLRMVNLLIALSLGVHLEQLEHRIGFTWPLPFLLRPL